MSQDSWGQPNGPRNPYADTVPIAGAIPVGSPGVRLEPVVPEQYVGYPGQQFFEAFNYQFQSPNWMMNLVWGAVAILSGMVIPIVGPLIFTGYQFRVVDTLLRSNGTRFPDFNFDDIEDYFLRGLWAILASLIPTVIVGPVIVAMFFAMFAIIGVAGAGNPEGPPELAAGAVVGTLVFFGFCWMTFMIVLSVLTAPLILRAGLGKDFGRAFHFGWCWDFAVKMWPEMILAGMFMFVVSLALIPLGLLMCFFGIYLISPVISFMQSHFWYQWYRIYLERGGEPILMTVKGNPQPPTQAMGPEIGSPQINPQGPPPKPNPWQ